MNNNKKVCIITPDIVGPIKNGGIGTHCFYLGKFLSQEMLYDVTILHTGPIENESIQFWRGHYRSNFNIQYIHESELLPIFNGECYGGRLFLVRSQKVYNWLKEQNFDSCHFQEWQANGFVSIQAKRTGQAFFNTTLTCTAHSSSEWIREGMQQFPPNKLDDMLLDYMERYCQENADYSLSPSQYMFDWMQSHGWEMSKKSLVLPYLLDLDHTITEASSKLAKKCFDRQHIIFFGRLEVRKGFDIFVQALNILAIKLKNRDRKIKITFLGKNGQTSCGSPINSLNQYLKENIGAYEITFETQMSHFDALNFLKSHPSALVVIPSLLDNFPYVCLECAVLGLNVIASNVGGIPEIICDEACLFSPTPQDLARKLEECINFGVSSTNSFAYSPQKAKSLWQKFFEMIDNSSGIGNIYHFPDSVNQNPKVSVCVPHYNYGKYLPDLLLSLERQTYNNFEVIVVDDGSTDEASLEVFSKMEEQYKEKNWKFIRKTNGGIGNTRNFAASKSTGEYIVFMDADNAAEPDMIQKMVKGITISNCDCLTCYFRAVDESLSIFSRVYAYAYCPVGACVEAGVYENVFGDANFIIKKDSFFSIGGFKEDRDTSWEDWEFLARLTIAGYKLDVIPDFLFLYRYTPKGFSRVTSHYKNHNRVLRAYFENMSFWNRRLILSSIPTVPLNTLNTSNFRAVSFYSLKTLIKAIAWKVLRKFSNTLNVPQGIRQRIKKILRVSI